LTRADRVGEVQAAAERIEGALDDLAGLPDRRAGQWGEELVRCVTELYGAALVRILDAACDPDAPRGSALLDALADDPLVGGILLVHDLHPRSLRQRLERALADLRTSLPAADVRLLDLDEDAAAVRLRVVVSGAGEAAAAGAEQRVRDAVGAAAPELIAVEIDRLLLATPVRFTRRPAVEAR
jgi:hypothetical protein